MVEGRACSSCATKIHRSNKSGLCRSCIQLGENNSNYRGRMYRKNYCINCDKEILLDSKRCYSCAVKYEHIIRANDWIGENNGMWNGGYASYYGKNWIEQRNKALIRDDNMCQRCGITREEFGKNMHVHHIVPFRTFNYIVGENDNYLVANEIDNLVCLCDKCHMHIEYNDTRQEREMKKRQAKSKRR